MEVRPSKTHYSFSRYVHQARWNSYYFQILETLKLQPKSVLEIGRGQSAYKPILEQEGITYACIDLEEDQHPDYVGGVDDMPIENESFDVVVAFQVLEHLPYDTFETSLSEMARVSKKHVLISLPDKYAAFRFFLKIPFVPELKKVLKIPITRTLKPGGHHFWNIGNTGYPSKRIRADIEKHFTILDEYVLFENPTHRFYVLEKK